MFENSGRDVAIYNGGGENNGDDDDDYDDDDDGDDCSENSPVQQGAHMCEPNHTSLTCPPSIFTICHFQGPQTECSANSPGQSPKRSLVILFQDARQPAVRLFDLRFNCASHIAARLVHGASHVKVPPSPISDDRRRLEFHAHDPPEDVSPVLHPIVPTGNAAVEGAAPHADGMWHSTVKGNAGNLQPKRLRMERVDRRER